VLGTIPYFQNQVYFGGVEHLCLAGKSNPQTTKVSQLKVYDLLELCLDVKPLKNCQKSLKNTSKNRYFFAHFLPKFTMMECDNEQKFRWFYVIISCILVRV